MRPLGDESGCLSRKLSQKCHYIVVQFSQTNISLESNPVCRHPAFPTHELIISLLLTLKYTFVSQANYLSRTTMIIKEGLFEVSTPLETSCPRWNATYVRTDQSASFG